MTDESIDQDLQELGIEEEHTPPQPLIANMWRRLGGAFVDLIVLAIISGILATIIHVAGIPIGQWGRLIGFAIGVAYLGLLNSKVGGGRTIGKRIASTMTVDANMQPLEVGPALLRGAFLSAIFIVNGLTLSVGSIVVQIIFGSLVGVILFCGGFLLLYNYLFNKQTRQGPHDWLAKSYVVTVPVEETTAGMPEASPTHNRVAIGCLGLYAVLLIGVVIFSLTGAQSLFGLASLGNMTDLRSDILQSGRYSNVGVGVNSTTQVGNPNFDTLVTLNITAQTSYRCGTTTACMDQVDDIARIALDEYEDVDSLTGMRVTIIRETHLGWFRLNNSVGAAYSIADWEERLDN